MEFQKEKKKKKECKIKRENPMPRKRGDRKKKLLKFVVTKIQTLTLTH